jgi:hypothetical protein
MRAFVFRCSGLSCDHDQCADILHQQLLTNATSLIRTCGERAMLTKFQGEGAHSGPKLMSRTGYSIGWYARDLWALCAHLSPSHERLVALQQILL